MIPITDMTWDVPPVDLFLPDGVIHIWRASLDEPSLPADQVVQMLSPPERARAGRFRFDADRRRFITSHAQLRCIASRYLGKNPREIEFSVGAHGKPYLISPRGGAALQFNLSHSHEFAIYAFTRNCRVGIDLEYIRALDADEIAGHFFSVNESNALHILTPSEKPKAFFTVWTRKEAHLKALGKGLSKPLDQFDVWSVGEQPIDLWDVDDNEAQISRWSLITFAPASGYLASLAIEGQLLPMQYFDWLS